MCFCLDPVGSWISKTFKYHCRHHCYCHHDHKHHHHKNHNLANHDCHHNNDHHDDLKTHCVVAADSPERDLAIKSKHSSGKARCSSNGTLMGINMMFILIMIVMAVMMIDHNDNDNYADW